jgi:hypothetical protein
MRGYEKKKIISCLEKFENVGSNMCFESTETSSCYDIMFTYI